MTVWHDLRIPEKGYLGNDLTLACVATEFSARAMTVLSRNRTIGLLTARHTILFSPMSDIASHQLHNRPRWRIGGLWHYFAMVLLTVLFYFPLVLPGMGLPAGGDFFAFHTPYRIFTSQKLHEGILPLYAHEIFGGYPVFQDPQFALLYPVNLIFGLLVPDAGSQGALDAYVLINLVLLSLAALFFMRSFRMPRLAAVAGAAVTCFNGFIVVHVTHINMVQVLTMSLLAAGFIARFWRNGATDIRLVVGAAVALACGNLAGHPQTTMYTHYAIAAGALALAVELWRGTGNWRSSAKVVMAAGLAMGFGVLLAAVQLIPTAELLRISTRASVSRAEVMWSGLEIHKLPSMIFPGFYMRLPWSAEWPPYYHTIMPEDPRAWFAWLDENFSEAYAALGLTALILGLAGWFYYWRSWLVQVLGWGCVFLLGCATGDDLPFYGWLYEAVPGFRLVRVSTRILLVFFPAWGLLAGLGLQALQRGDTKKVRRSAAAAFGVVTVCLAGWLMWALRRHKGDWLDTWITAFAGQGGYIGRIILERRADEYLGTLTDQLVLGIIFIIVISSLFMWPVKRPRLRGLLVAGVLAVEMTIYCFGWATAMNYPGITTVKSPELASLPPSSKGRALNFTAPNMALYMDRKVANGYSVTLDDWVTALQPDAVPPFRSGMQETLVDLWNVSDIATKRTPREAAVGDKLVALDDWGWTEIGGPWTAQSGETSVSTRALMPTRLDLALETTQPVKQLHLVAFTGRAGSTTDSVKMARVILKNSTGEVLTSAPVLLGMHVSDARYPLDDRKEGRPVHSRAPFSYYRIIPNHWSSGVSFFDARLDVATSQPLGSISIEATGPFPTTLGVNCAVAVLADGSFVLKDFFGMEGFSEVPSREPGFRVMHRDNVPGYARMVATATPGSYKRTENIMWRMFNGEIDARESIIVDKRKFNEDEVRCVNAPHPQAFRGSAALEWVSDRHGRIITSANMNGWLFLSQTWDEGWRAEVDGEPAEIYRANGPFMAIPLTGGDHEVHLRYRPAGLMAGLTVSGLTVVALMAIYWRWRPRNLRGSTEPI